MIILSYSLVVENCDKDNFESFLKNDFHPFLIITFQLANFTILKLKTPEENETDTFIIQFYFTNFDEVEQFKNEFQETIMTYISVKTQLKFYYFDSLLESIE